MPELFELWTRAFLGVLAFVGICLLFLGSIGAHLFAFASIIRYMSYDYGGKIQPLKALLWALVLLLLLSFDITLYCACNGLTL